jgi:hypothetical protein
MENITQARPGEREEPLDSAAQCFSAGAERLAEAIEALREVEALALPFLTEPARLHLLGESERIGYRPARPTVGPPERQVIQDFEVALDFPRFPPESPFSRFARLFEELTAEALARLDPPPYGRRLIYNDVMVQRYAAGCRGITPHRDHLRYEGLVALFPLSGQARYCLCADREGSDPIEIPTAPGDLILMRGWGLHVFTERPFHFLDRVTKDRVSLGLRYDVKAEP